MKFRITKVMTMSTKQRLKAINKNSYISNRVNLVNTGLVSFARNMFLLSAVTSLLIGNLANAGYPTNHQTPETPADSSLLHGLWASLWQTSTQQAQIAFNHGKFEQAADLYAKSHQTRWQASSEYKAGDYQNAAHLFREQHQYYNLGNALAKSGDLQGAVQAYETHLQTYPNDSDAMFNRDLIKNMLKQQQTKQQDKQPANKQGHSKEENPKQTSQVGESPQTLKKQQEDKQQSAHQESEGTDKYNYNQPVNKGKDKNDKQEQSQSTNKTPEKQGEKVHNQVNHTQPLDQATEQILRRVPDDSSGLLRNRIIQHYQNQQR